MSPHPADPTLTTDNLMEVVKGVEHCWEDLGLNLGVQQAKRVEINWHCSSEHRKMEATLDHYVRSPTPSWKEFAGALQEMNLHKEADVVTTKYVKGMNVNHVTCLILIPAVDGQLWYLMVNYGT